MGEGGSAPAEPGEGPLRGSWLHCVLTRLPSILAMSPTLRQPAAAVAGEPIRPSSRGDRRRKGLYLLGGVALVLLLAAAGLRIGRSPRPVSALSLPPEVDRSSLVLQVGRWVRPPGDAPFCGLMTDRYPDGQLMSRSAVSNGVLNGLSEGWHPNGALQIAEHFENGRSHGLRAKWYSSGAKQSEVTVRDGRLHGTLRRWHENGRLAESIPLSNGEPDGVSWAFYPSGRTQARARHAHSALVESEFWKDGEPTAPAPETTP